MEWRAYVRSSLSAQHLVVSDDVVEELAQHAEEAYEQARGAGSSVREAVARARDLVDAWSHQCSWQQPIRHTPPPEPPPGDTSRWTGLYQDLHYGFRQMRRQPAFALLATGLIGATIAALATVMSVAYVVLLKPLPWPDADRLIVVAEMREGATRQPPNTLTNATYLAWRDRPSAIENIAGYSSRTVTLEGTAEPARIRAVWTTASLFKVLESAPLYGMVFTDSDETRDRAHVALVSHRLWQHQLAARQDVLGTSIKLDGEAFRVIGIMPADFGFPTDDTEAWLPWQVSAVIDPNDASHRSLQLFRSIARLAPGVTAAQAASEATARSQAAPDLGIVGTAVFGAHGKPRVIVRPYLDAQTAEVRPALFLLVVGVLLLLATAVTNIAGLQLARFTARRRELAIRSALGAGRGRITRQLAMENVATGLVGSAIGATLANVFLGALRKVLPVVFPRVAHITADWHVFGIAIVTALATTALVGMLPALLSSRVNLVMALAEDSLAPIGGRMTSRIGRVRSALMAAQVAMAVILLVCAALLTRSLIGLLQFNRGYEARNLLTAVLPLPDSRFPQTDSRPAGQRRAAVLDDILQRLTHTPGVVDAAAASAIPLLPYDQPLVIALASEGTGGPATAQANLRTVSPGFFAALGLRLVAGRVLTDADTSTSEPVVVVNRTFASKYLPENPLGARLPITLNSGGTDSVAVVGLVDDVREQSTPEPPAPEIFASYRQRQDGMRMSAPVLIVRTYDDPSAMIPVLRHIVQEEDRTLALDSVMTMDDRLLVSLARARLNTFVLVVFAGVTLLLAGSGLFAILSYTVAQRVREIGVRTALGARPGQIIWLVGRQALVIAGVGLGIGLILSRALSGTVGGPAVRRHASRSDSVRPRFRRSGRRHDRGMYRARSTCCTNRPHMRAEELMKWQRRNRLRSQSGAARGNIEVDRSAVRARLQCWRNHADLVRADEC